MKIHTELIKIGTAWSLDLTIPVISYGKGRPILSIVSGLHGDEPTGALASHMFLKELRRIGLTDGSVKIVPSANPLAQIVDSRVHTLDFMDLNRVGKGHKLGSLTERTADMLFNILQNSDLVIDLHEFKMNTPTMGIFVKPCRAETGEFIFRQLSKFCPEIVWVMDFDRSDEAQYSDSLIASLIRNNIPAFAVEVTSCPGDAEAHTVSRGLLRVAQSLGIADGAVACRAGIRAYRRFVQTAEYSGVWQPDLNFFTEISKGKTVGTITSFDLSSAYDVVSLFPGHVLQLLRPKVVHTGENIFAIGELDEEITAALSTNEDQR